MIKLSRHTDPATSKAAGTALEGSKRLGEMQAATLDLIQAYPGLTYGELLAIASNQLWFTGANRKLRTAELLQINLIHTGALRKSPATGRMCLTWWPGPEPEDWNQGDLFKCKWPPG